MPVKPNSLAERQEKKGGAKPGHVGHGREGAEPEEADRVETVEVDDTCPCCGGKLEAKGLRTRTVVEGRPLKVEKTAYVLRRKWCPRCKRSLQPRAPGVLPNPAEAGLYGNHLLTHVTVQHYVYGVPLGRLEAQVGIGYGSLIAPLHRLSRFLEPVVEKLTEEYRQSPFLAAGRQARR